MGMGGGGSGSGSTPNTAGAGQTVSANALPQNMQDSLNSLMSRAATQSQTSYTPYSGQRVAGLAPIQEQGINAIGAAGATANDWLGQAANKSASIGQYNPQMTASQNISGQNVNAKDVTAGTFPQVNISDYMNPYTQNVVDTTNQEINRQNQITNQQAGSHAASQGAFGGSRDAIVQSENNRNALNTIARNTAGLNQQGYTQAQNTAETDLTRMLQAQGMNQSANLQGQLANQSTDLQAQRANQASGLQSQMANQSAGLQGAGLGLNAANSLANFANSSQNMNIQQGQADIAAGNIQQQNQQQNLNVPYQNYLNAQQYPYQNLQFLSGIYSGIPYNNFTTQVNSTATPSGLAQGIGAGAAGLGALANSGVLNGLFGGSGSGSADQSSGILNSGSWAGGTDLTSYGFASGGLIEPGVNSADAGMIDKLYDPNQFTRQMVSQAPLMSLGPQQSQAQGGGGSSGGSGGGSSMGQTVGKTLGGIGGSVIGGPIGGMIGGAVGDFFGGLFAEGGRVPGYADGGLTADEAEAQGLFTPQPEPPNPMLQYYDRVAGGMQKRWDAAKQAEQQSPTASSLYGAIKGGISSLADPSMAGTIGQGIRGAATAATGYGNSALIAGQRAIGQPPSIGTYDTTNDSLYHVPNFDDASRYASRIAGGIQKQVRPLVPQGVGDSADLSGDGDEAKAQGLFTPQPESPNPMLQYYDRVAGGMQKRWDAAKQAEQQSPTASSLYGAIKGGISSLADPSTARNAASSLGDLVQTVPAYASRIAGGIQKQVRPLVPQGVGDSADLSGDGMDPAAAMNAIRQSQIGKWFANAVGLPQSSFATGDGDVTPGSASLSMPSRHAPQDNGVDELGRPMGLSGIAEQTTMMPTVPRKPPIPPDAQGAMIGQQFNPNAGSPDTPRPDIKPPIPPMGLSAIANAPQGDYPDPRMDVGTNPSMVPPTLSRPMAPATSAPASIIPDRPPGIGALSTTQPMAPQNAAAPSTSPSIPPNVLQGLNVLAKSDPQKFAHTMAQDAAITAQTGQPSVGSQLMRFGLEMMATKSPSLMGAVGQAGLNTLSAQQQQQQIAKQHEMEGRKLDVEQLFRQQQLEAVQGRAGAAQTNAQAHMYDVTNNKSLTAQAQADKLAAQAKHYGVQDQDIRNSWEDDSSRGVPQGTTMQVIAALKQDNPNLTTEQALNIYRSRSNSGLINQKMEGIAANLAKADPGGFKDPVGTLNKYRSVYGLSTAQSAPAQQTPPIASTGATQAPQAQMPPQIALSRLKEGVVTTFNNGQKWTIRNGQPAQVQ